MVDTKQDTLRSLRKATMKLIEKTRYRIQYVGKEETYAPLVAHLKFIESREYAKQVDAESWRRSYINGERWSFYESDFILVPVEATYVKDSFAARYFTALKEQVQTNDTAMVLLVFAGIFLFVAGLVAVVTALFPDFGAGQDSSVSFVAGVWVILMFAGTGVCGWLGGALFDMNRRKDLRIPA